MNILSHEKVIKLMLEEAVSSVYFKHLYISVKIYGYYYQQYCERYLLPESPAIIKMIEDSEKKTAEQEDNNEN